MAHSNIAETLRCISQEMQRLELWHDEAPTQEQLASQLPFCVDTLSFTQWLQWVMFPKVIVIIETKAVLNSKSNMSVMAEQAFKNIPSNTHYLLELIQQLDKQLSNTDK